VRRGAAAAVAVLAAAAVVVVAVAALDGDGSDRTGERVGVRAARSIVTPPRIYPYPAAAVSDFVGACVMSAPDEVRTCRCVVDDLQTRLPYPEFQAGDRAVRRGQPLPPRAKAAIDAATRECRRVAS
jgi:hypothetical protein